jgi:hypothetical protein
MRMNESQWDHLPNARDGKHGTVAEFLARSRLPRVLERAGNGRAVEARSEPEREHGNEAEHACGGAK